uniref:Cytosolic arginine sensor for mTORC1 subunit 1 n=1 Tax=Apteryx owenii TaxID=8824 RepID=A0A8B9Q5B7_APTOW
MDLHILEHRVRVLSVARRGLWLYTHPLVKLLFLPQRCRCKFFSLTETPEDYTIMLDEEGFKELPPSEFMQVADSTWLVLSVVSNGRASSGCQATGVTKIAKSVIAPLAEHNVSVLMLSTYQTDFILVREKDLPMVIHTLAGEFDIYKEENGESVPVNCDDVSNGFLKPKPAASPTVHPVQSPQNRFCILTVAPDTLPAIATMLIDVLFYSHRFPSDLLLTSSTGELWRMVRIGGQPLGFDECGIVAQIAEPLANVDISAYYISTFNFDHALVSLRPPGWRGAAFLHPAMYQAAAVGREVSGQMFPAGEAVLPSARSGRLRALAPFLASPGPRRRSGLNCSVVLLLLGWEVQERGSPGGRSAPGAAWQEPAVLTWALLPGPRGRHRRGHRAAPATPGERQIAVPAPRAGRGATRPHSLARW